MSQNAPYNHYADKDALLVALATHSFEQLGDQMVAAAATAEPGGEIVAVAKPSVRVYGP